MRSLESDVAELVGKFAPERLKDPEYVTKLLGMNLCPACGAEEVLVGAHRDLVVCQVCALRCLRLTELLWAAQTPAPPRPPVPLALWFATCLAAYGRHPDGRAWVPLLAGGRWVEQWASGWDAWRSIVHHKVREMAGDKEIMANWPDALRRGWVIADGPHILWHQLHPPRPAVDYDPGSGPPDPSAKIVGRVRE
jgi:hypothetical protein